MKRSTHLFYFPLLLFVLLTTNLYAVAAYVAGSTATELATQIQGNGITITNPVITHGASTQVGIYSNGIAGANLEIDKGIILTGSTVAESFTTNSSGSTSLRPSGTYSDVDLIAIDANAVFNPVIFEFDVTLDANTRLLLIDYQFASEEYNEYVGSQFNDTFGFFISGGDLPANTTYNIARVVDNQTYVTIANINNYKPVTVNNVNNGTLGIYDDGTPQDLTNSAFFIDNDRQNNGAPVKIEYDGITHTLHATLDNLTAGETYHFKMALADTGDSQWDTGVFVNKISGLREPSICYDYAYKQNGLFLTEGYDAVKGPFISGDVIANDSSLPVEVAMYFQNTKDSEIIASNITLDILDINITQATYTPGSVFVTETNSLTKVAVADVDLNVSDSYIKEIPITSFDAFDYFYTYFSLDPIMSSLSLPITARITYDLTIPLSVNDSLTINRSSLIDTDIPICGGGTSTYNPVYGAFNIIENELYTDDTNYLYNINTQVTNRDASLSVVSVNTNTTTNPDLHDLQSITTAVWVDMLDLKSFHYTGASCSESGNAISDKTLVIFDGVSMTPLSTSNVNFYQTARENVALRISYNVDANGSLIELEAIESGGERRWNVLNFSDAVKIGQCAVDIANGTDTVAQWCSNSGTSFNSAMTDAELEICMKCVYGLSTKLICSRDNFSIRPEAFLMHLDDQNQTNPTLSKVRLTTNYSGVAAPTNARLNLAAGYKYNLEVNATNHLDNTASIGYNFHLDNTVVDGEKSSYYKWAPSDTTLDSAKCNDIENHEFTTIFINGAAVMNGMPDMNTSINQVGDYNLTMLDAKWTSIDRVQQSHHTGSYFLAGPDCVLDDSGVANVNSNDSGNGCNISTSHTNADANLVYNYYSMTFHPYKFSIIPTMNLGFNDVNVTLITNPFVYISDINTSADENMSVRLNAVITAKGYNDIQVNNFVTECYAKPLDINVSDSNISNVALILNYRFHDYNLTGDLISANDINGSTPRAVNRDINISTTSSYFQKASNGSINTTIALNFIKDLNTTANPEKILFGKYKVIDPNNTFSADFNASSLSDGNVSLDQNVTFYYGRTASKRVKEICDPAVANCDASDVFIYYEVFCNKDTNGTICDQSLLPVSSITGNSLQKVDSRWFVNFDHNTTIDGNITNSIDSINPAYVILPNGITHPIGTDAYSDSLHRYPVVNGLPYTAVMQDTVPSWLIYDENDPFAIFNHHTVTFRPKSEWSGVHEADSTTKTDRIKRVNRRTMW